MFDKVQRLKTDENIVGVLSPVGYSVKDYCLKCHTLVGHLGPTVHNV